MSYADNLWLFFTLLVGIIIVPGMDMLFVMANALTGGRSAGLSATLGIMVGGATHALFGAVGIGALLAFAPWALTLMIFAGAAYMAWIGVTLIRSSIVVDAVGGARSRSLRVAFRQGVVTCLLNPKAYLFTLAVYPQFLKPVYGPVWSQALVMGVMTVLVQLAIYGGVALAAGKSRDFLIASPHVTIFIGRAAGVLFLVIAVFTAWHGWTATS